MIESVVDFCITGEPELVPENVGRGSVFVERNSRLTVANPASLSGITTMHPIFKGSKSSNYLKPPTFIPIGPLVSLHRNFFLSLHVFVYHVINFT